jgi:hypothetical protein
MRSVLFRHRPSFLASWLGACAVAVVCAAAGPAKAQPTEPAVEPVDIAELEAAISADPNADTSAPKAGDGARPDRQGMNPDISLVADFALAVFSDEDHLQTGAHDPTRTGFNLQQVELSIGGAVDPYFRFDSYLVFGLFGVELEEAYATTLDMPLRLQARMGQFLARFGRHNSRHPHAWQFADQPFVLGRYFGAESLRGLGAELSWLTPLPWSVELVGSVTGADGEATARSFFGAEDLGIGGPADLLYVTAVKQFFPLSDNWSLAWGVSGAFGPNSTGRDNRTEVYGTDVYLKYRPITEGSYTEVSLTTEWLYRRRQIPEDVLQDFGSYTELFWRFARRFGTGVRYEYGSPALDQEIDPVADDPLDPEWADSRHRASAAITHWPTEFSRFRLQGSYDMALWRESVWAAFLTAEFVLGAHGAHEF